MEGNEGLTALAVHGRSYPTKMRCSTHRNFQNPQTTQVLLEDSSKLTPDWRPQYCHPALKTIVKVEKPSFFVFFLGGGRGGGAGLRIKDEYLRKNHVSK